jgi:hypothetical protein
MKETAIFHFLYLPPKRGKWEGALPLQQSFGSSTIRFSAIMS